MKDNIFCHIITDIHHESSNNMTHLTHSRANGSRYKTTALIVGTGGTVFYFFIGKMDQGMTVLWLKTEVVGQFCVFFKQL